MKTNIDGIRKKRLREAVDKLTEENQRCALGIVEALAFAQTQKTAKTAFPACKTQVKEPAR
jgi:hypothetical protein